MYYQKRTHISYINVCLGTGVFNVMLDNGKDKNRDDRTLETVHCIHFVVSL